MADEAVLNKVLLNFDISRNFSFSLPKETAEKILEMSSEEVGKLSESDEER